MLGLYKDRPNRCKIYTKINPLGEKTMVHKSLAEWYEETYRKKSPVTTQPATSAPVTSQPVTVEPVTSEPVTSMPVTSQPVTDELVTSEPVTLEPFIIEPIGSNEPNAEFDETQAASPPSENAGSESGETGNLEPLDEINAHCDDSFADGLAEEIVEH